MLSLSQRVRDKHGRAASFGKKAKDVGESVVSFGKRAKDVEGSVISFGKRVKDKYKGGVKGVRRGESLEESGEMIKFNALKT